MLHLIPNNIKTFYTCLNEKPRHSKNFVAIQSHEVAIFPRVKTGNLNGIEIYSIVKNIYKLIKLLYFVSQAIDLQLNQYNKRAIDRVRERGKASKNKSPLNHENYCQGAIKSSFSKIYWHFGNKLSCLLGDVEVSEGGNFRWKVYHLLFLL